MGTDYYAKIPAWKTLYMLGRRDFEDNELEVFIDKYKELEKEIENFNFDMLEQSYKGTISLTDFADLIRLARSVYYLIDNYFPKFMFLKILKRAKVKFEIINDITVDIYELERKGWLLVD